MDQGRVYQKQAPSKPKARVSQLILLRALNQSNLWRAMNTIQAKMRMEILYRNLGRKEIYARRRDQSHLKERSQSLQKEGQGGQNHRRIGPTISLSIWMEVEPTYRTMQTAQEADHKTIRMHYLRADRMQGMLQAKYHQCLLQLNSVAKPLEILLNSKQLLFSS